MHSVPVYATTVITGTHIAPSQEGLARLSWHGYGWHGLHIEMALVQHFTICIIQLLNHRISL